MSISRSYVVADIWQGPIDVYVNITAPTSSLYPTADSNILTFDASNQPTSSAGFHLGSIESPTQLNIVEKSNEIMDDQHDTAIDVAFDGISAEIDFTMKETNLSRLVTLLSSAFATYTALSNSKVMQVGGKLDSAATPVTLLLVGPNRVTAGKLAYVMGYKSYLKSPIPFNWQRTKETVFKMKFGCVMDLTRAVGDEVLQIVRTK